MYKHTDTMLPWFPHDNDMELLKELVHESGRPRWVIFGTPAHPRGGAGMRGCLEMGLSVVALCSEDHHRDVLNRCMLERAVEAMVSQTNRGFQGRFFAHVVDTAEPGRQRRRSKGRRR